jgi:hypothetical protein
MADLVRVLPLPIQVVPGKGSSVVALDHSVGIEHWDYLDDKLIPEFFGIGVGST